VVKPRQHAMAFDEPLSPMPTRLRGVSHDNRWSSCCCAYVGSWRDILLIEFTLVHFDAKAARRFHHINGAVQRQPEPKFPGMLFGR